jgi:cysteinyl-tRNA synthetase
MHEQPLYDRIELTVHNSLTRSRERFRALSPPHVGMYVCGPTVYSDPHLGHARAALAFDTVFRFLRFLGYRVRYVRNITDVGHLEDETADAGEDKILKRARLERVEPMEVVHQYTVSYHEGMRRLGCLPPSIEPTASGHIVEQIQVVERILDAGLAYERDGSVYFDLEKYVREGSRGTAAAVDGDAQGATPYGVLSGKVFEDLLSNTRATAGAQEKKSALDFALWKRAEANHIMRWPSPWGEGFPGWHLECTTMSTRYLGETFDIHGGGLDLQFPHHEAEIAQSHGAFGVDPARYWLHSNMLTVASQKMAKSLGNFITLEEMFNGNHPALDQPWHPMVVRFFMLQSHYRSTVDFSNEALRAAEKGFKRLMGNVRRAEQYLAEAERGADAAGETTGTGAATTGADGRPAAGSPFLRAEAGPRIDPLAMAGASLPAPGTLPESLAEAAPESHEGAIAAQIQGCWEAMAEDFHTPRTIAALFELARLTQRPEHGKAAAEVREAAARTLVVFTRDVLGLVVGADAGEDRPGDGGSAEADRGDTPLDAAMDLLISIRREARERKDFSTADGIRDRLAAAGIQLEDRKDGTTGWTTK